MWLSPYACAQPYQSGNVAAKEICLGFLDHVSTVIAGNAQAVVRHTIKVVARARNSTATTPAPPRPTTSV